ncbi:stalk domain-containing protein [Thermanaeromonas sp. C210]|uniref:stalk domain-containing protein n=1 Tax=Thermanaeromonas sp. C210 TaxID=2731925 RepID=UPI00155CC6CB|nr:stalk domain-containing protein [Thermanaeromonas sp. C210]GFN22157.1 copper amine oxidase-like protein [Thermanaeromonas sp. C210]
MVKKGLAALGSALIFLAVAAAAPAAPFSIEKPGEAVLEGEVRVFLGDRELSWEISPSFSRDGHFLVPVRDLGRALGAEVSWDEKTQRVLVTSSQATVGFQIGSSEAIVDGEKVTLPSPAILKNGRAMVPLRFLTQVLGLAVNWDDRTQTATLVAPPERVYREAFPARVAFTANNNLWLLDGSQAGAQPVQVTKGGSVQILGWSPDGLWLAYLQRETPEPGESKPYLWVVKYDGSSAVQVDPRPVIGEPQWSPRDNILAYSTQDPGLDYIPDCNLKLATVAEEGVQVKPLLDQGLPIEDWAWAPDGQSLAISFRRTAEEPWRIDRLNLRGERTNLIKGMGTGNPIGEVYFSHPVGLKWSPNGRYLAYYLRYNAASLSADGVPLEVLDVENPQKPLNLGIGLPYRRWSAWSPDGNKLAFIEGSGRQATYNKRLLVVTLPEGDITSYGQPGTVDSQPTWLPGPQEDLLFCRGTAATVGDKGYPEAGMSYRRIWRATGDGKAAPLTDGLPDEADWYPSSSLDGLELYFLRLKGSTAGSLYRQPLTGGWPEELVRNITGSSGYYGSYYPPNVSIYPLPPTGEAEGRSFAGRLVESLVEGRHLELETEDYGILVVIPASPEVAAALEGYVGQEVVIEGTLEHKPNIYMRGPLLRVLAVKPRP